MGWGGVTRNKAGVGGEIVGVGERFNGQYSFLACCFMLYCLERTNSVTTICTMVGLEGIVSLGIASMLSGLCCTSMCGTRGVLEHSTLVKPGKCDAA